MRIEGTTFSSPRRARPSVSTASALRIRKKRRRQSPSPARRSLRDAARATLLLPDPDIRWSLRLRAAVLAHDAPPPDWVISSSPPESLHVAAWSLARRYGARWLADFRDHWIENPLRPERRDAPARALVERGIARALLAQVDAASAVDAPIAEELRRYAPSASIAIIGHFAEAPTRRVDLPGETVNLAHTGSFTLSDPDRRIGPLLSAFEKARKREPRLALHLVGRLTDDERAAAQGSPAASAIRLHGVVDYEQARGFQAAADGLVLAIAEGQHGVPGKYAEYGLSGKPVVVLQGGTLMDIAEGALTPSGGLDAAAERLASVADARPASQAGLTLDEAIDRWETLMALR